ncbi:hypothetical protein C1645_834442 [Glomus cerebriforme]|uniref:Uncharacterized protein n=1 Tax=Glomus cerebriforme TaxID=658196 RepID=A0A397SAK5_9GLOM|nr:hypothetical protein C1645_834442 [Glomus cerebriforme]
MSNLDSSILFQKYASEDDLMDSEDEVFELDSNFDQFTIRFSNALSEMLAHEDEDDIEMEAYIGKYDNDIETELEQDNNEQNFDNEQEEKDEIIPNDEGSTSKKYNELLLCVIIDNIHGVIKWYGETYKIRKMRNLFGTWQIDRDAVQQVNNDHLKLGPTFNEIKKPRYICCTCYKQLGGHIHKCTGRDKKSNCIQLHEKDTTKGIKIIANWLINISNTDEETKKDDILKSIVKAILPFLPTSSTKTISSTTNNTESDESPLSLFIIQILFLDIFLKNKIHDDAETINYESLGQKFGIKLWKSHKAINEKKDSLNSPKSLLEYYYAFSDFVTEFFQGLLIEIFNRKLAVSNRKRKHWEQITKTLPKNTITKIVTFFASVLVGIAFSSCSIWLTSVLSSLAYCYDLNDSSDINDLSDS